MKLTQGKIAFVAFATGLAFYAGAKHQTGSISFPFTDVATRYLTNAGSYVTNDAVCVNFTRNPLVPASAWFYLDACPLSVTSAAEVAANSFTVFSNRFADITLPLEVPYPAATNYNWFGYTDWTPSPTVHTNGVAFVLWRHKAANEYEAVVVPYRTGVYCDRRRVSPDAAITNGPPISLVRGGPANDEEENQR